MDLTRTLHGYIEDVVRQQLRGALSYWGEVMKRNDGAETGKVLVTIPALGFYTEDQAVWAAPARIHGLVVPDVGERVMVSFVEGDQGRPVYWGQAHWLKGATAAAYDGPDKVVLYQDPDEGLTVTYDRSSKSVTVDGGKDVTLAATGNVTVEASGNATVKDGYGNEIQMRSAGITLKTGDAVAWAPNILPNCLFNGAPHGGAAAAIVKLKGG